MLLGTDEAEVRQCLKYLAKHLRGPTSPAWTEQDETFYLMALRSCSLAALKRTFREGISRWRYMPKPADIMTVYREITAGPGPYLGPTEPSVAGCPECDGTGWRPAGPRAVSPCSCPKGQVRRARLSPPSP